MRDAFRKIGAAIGLASAVLGVVTAYAQFHHDIPNDARLGFLVVTGLAVLSFGLLIHQEYRYSRKARYAEITWNVLTAVRVSGSSPAERAVDARNELCSLTDEIAEAFTLLTGTRASSCLKRILLVGVAPHLRPHVDDVVRDKKSEGIRNPRNAKKTALGNPTMHWVDANSDFNHLFENAGSASGRFYLSNNLPIERDYRNTSFDLYGLPTSWNFPVLGSMARRMKWPLPYRSTLVVPVVSRTSSDEDSTVLGYLCVDCQSRYVFDSRYDVPLLETFAQIAAPILSRFLDLKEAESRTAELSSNLARA